MKRFKICVECLNFVLKNMEEVLKSFKERGRSDLYIRDIT